MTTKTIETILSNPNAFVVVDRFRMDKVIAIVADKTDAHIVADQIARSWRVGTAVMSALAFERAALAAVNR